MPMTYSLVFLLYSFIGPLGLQSEMLRTNGILREESAILCHEDQIMIRMQQNFDHPDNFWGSRSLHTFYYFSKSDNRNNSIKK